MAFNTEPWYQRLAARDRLNLQKTFVNVSDWINQRGTDSQLGEHKYAMARQIYFAMYAIGGLARAEGPGKDLDLLLVTNHVLNDTWEPPTLADLFNRLDPHFDIKASIAGETFEGDNDGHSFHRTLRTEAEKRGYLLANHIGEGYDRETDCRMVLTLTPRTTGRQIDLTYQWDIVSDEHWENHDKEPLIKIFRMGAANPLGRKNNLDDKHIAGIHQVPLDQYRLSRVETRTNWTW